MKRNTYRLTSLLLLTVLLAGCTIEVSDEIGDNGGLVPIYLTAEVADAGNGGSATRAGTDIQSTQLASGETFTVEFSSNTTVASTTYQANGSGGTTCTGTQPYFTLDGSSTTVYAYYPEKPGSTFSVQADQSGDANYKKSDLMYATVASLAKTGTATTASLTFSHKMAKIIVSATATSGVSQIKDVRIIGGSRTIDVTNITNCTLGTTLTDANSTSSYITMYSGGTATTASCAALIPPQTVNANFLQIVTDKGTVTYSLSNKAFATAQSYTFNITINAAAIGTTVAITGWTGTGNVTVQPTETNAPANAVAVDLGLSVKWANMNVGAEEVTDYGTYFAWGETDGITVNGATNTISGTPAKTIFNWYTYAWCNGASSSMTKYSTDASYWDDNIKSDTPDGKTQLELGDDAARANWGGKWRMPTQAEMEELVNNTDQEWTTINSVPVCKFMKKSDHNVYIFLPAAGRRRNASFDGQGLGGAGAYWSSTLYTDRPNSAWLLSFLSSARVNYGDRYFGLSVRPVQSN